MCLAGPDEDPPADRWAAGLLGGDGRGEGRGEGGKTLLGCCFLVVWDKRSTARLAGHNSIRHVMSFDPSIPCFIAGTGLCRARPPPPPGSGPGCPPGWVTGTGAVRAPAGDDSPPFFDLANRKRPKLYGKNLRCVEARRRAGAGLRRRVVCLVLIEAEAQSHESVTPNRRILDVGWASGWVDGWQGVWKPWMDGWMDGWMSG